MGWEFIKVDREGPITVVTLNRPDVYNALHHAAHVELDQAFNMFEADPDQWIAIITGAGEKAFCAGNDLKAQAGGGDLRFPKSGFAGLTQRFDSNKPIIAAVNGLAMGGGLEIALACDIVVAGENATFALPEPKVGVAALAGGLLRLPRQIGLKPAMGMILTGRRVSATEGKTLGFVNEVVRAADLQSAAMRWAQDMAQCSPMALRAAKEAVRQGLETALPEAMTEQVRYPAMRALFKSDDFKEGPRAFVQKRKPQWTGR